MAANELHNMAPIRLNRETASPWIIDMEIFECRTIPCPRIDSSKPTISNSIRQNNRKIKLNPLNGLSCLDKD